MNNLGGLSEDIGRLKFEQSSYKNIQGKRQPCYLLNRNAFTLLVMGYTTIRYIFNGYFPRLRR